MDDLDLKRPRLRADASRTMKTLLGLFVALPALLAFGSTSHVLTSGEVSHALMSQMNGSAAGQITQKVGCRLAAHADTHGDLHYTCVLTGKRASQRVFVTVHGTSWRAEFAPLQG
jgi:hypothetical protein